MALTVVEKFRGAGGDRLLHVHKITFDSSYPTGGEPLTAADLGWSDNASLLDVVALSGPYTFQYDAANAKILAYWVDTTVDGAAMAEVVNTTNLSTVSTYVLSFGKNQT